MAKQEITCDDILRELKAGQYRPIYYLMGEEPYYIDLISDYITDNVLNETEKRIQPHRCIWRRCGRGYNYQCRQTLSHDVRAPSVVVKEAQNIRNIEVASYYLQNPCYLQYW